MKQLIALVFTGIIGANLVNAIVIALPATAHVCIVRLKKYEKLMTLNQNSQLLVDNLAQLPLLDSRFEDIKLVNVNSLGQRAGCFSLVFKAFDVLTGKHVALKFYDPDPQWTNNIYRVNAFRREHEILTTLVSANRCLQLVSSLNTHIVSIDLPNGLSIQMSCQYFAVEWLEDQIDQFFLNQQNFSALEKLYLFNETLLSIESLHAKKVFHRDLKADNLRSFLESSKRHVVAIDLGTAARFDSNSIQETYGHTAGAPGYSAPEALCGLAGNRKIAKYTDLYALGCLLFELFNYDHFFIAVRALNPRYELLLTAMSTYVSGVTDADQQYEKWCAAITALSASILPVAIDGVGSNVPKAVAPVLNELLQILTAADFRQRNRDWSWIRARVWSAIRLLENDVESKRRMKEREAIRLRKLQKVKDKEARLDDWLKRRKSVC